MGARNLIPLLLVAELATGLAAAPHALESLSTGVRLRGPIKGHHRNKLWLQVPVVRTAAGGVLREVDAMLKVPRRHPLLKDPEGVMGKKLTVFVEHARPADACLVVSLNPPEPPELKSLSWRARCHAVANSTHLETLSTGQTLEGRVLNSHPFGAFVDVGVSRPSSRGRRLPVDAMLPSDQAYGRNFQRGDQLTVRVLQVVSSDRLLLTLSSQSTSEIEAAVTRRRALKAAKFRRPSLASLRAGSEREGIVERIEPFGAIVDVGARKSGLIHISELTRGQLVTDVEAICQVGDRVAVQILPKSTATKLSLRLVKVFARPDDAALDDPAATAMLRRGETLQPRFSRVSDAAIDAAAAGMRTGQGGEGREEAAVEAEEEGLASAMAAWGDVVEVGGASEDDDEASLNSAMAAWGDITETVSVASTTTSTVQGDETARGEEEGKEEQEQEQDGPDFDDDYFESKYDIDFY